MKAFDSAQQAAAAASAVSLAWLLEFEFNTPVYATIPGGIDIPWNGNTYRAQAALVIEQVVESASLVATGLKITVPGVSQSSVSLALSENIRGKTFRMRLALLDGDGQIIGTPTLEYEGRCDVPEIKDNPSDKGLTAIVSIAVESRLVDYARANVRRRTDADQQKMWPGDRFYEYAPQMVEQVVAWPSADFWRS